jgi:hypothetical protein
MHAYKPQKRLLKLSRLFELRKLCLSLVILLGSANPLKTNESELNTTGPDGFHQIFWAIKSLDAEKVEDILNSGTNIEVNGYAGSTPALMAAIGDVWVICLLLLERGANPNAANSAGMTMPWLAKTSRVNSNSETGVALSTVRSRLETLGLMDVIYDPAQVRRMIEDGMWPPK